VIYGNLLVVLICAPWGLPAVSQLTRHDLLSVMYLGVIQLGLSYVLFTIGMSRGVRSLDAGIVCYIEPVLNPVWVFLVLRERPSGWALIGGAIIITAVIIHMLLDAHSKRRASLEPAHG
jgi:drug/metabolite transporter (DMT)-like permease